MTAAVGRLTVIPFEDPANPRAAPRYVCSRALAANTHEEISIPAAAAYVRLAGTGDFYYSFSGNASVPADTDDGSACELVEYSCPEWLIVPAGATALSVISAATPIVTASFYST